MGPTNSSGSQHAIPPLLYVVAAVLLAARIWFVWWGA
jgi:hypothetical protein